jgi:phospholipase/carboxylesterase
MKGQWGEADGLQFIQVEAENAPDDLPLIFAMHGRGADARDLVGIAGEIDPNGYRWIFPQGPRPVQLAPGYTGWAWYELGEDRASTVVASREMLGAFIEAQMQRLGVPRNRTLLTGFSQGGVMTLHTGLSAEQPFAGLAVQSGALHAPETLERILPERRDRTLLWVHGTHDPTLPVELAHQGIEILKKAGLEPEYVELPMGHEITPQSLNIVRDYIHRVLPPGPPA